MHKGKEEAKPNPGSNVNLNCNYWYEDDDIQGLL